MSSYPTRWSSPTSSRTGGTAAASRDGCMPGAAMPATANTARRTKVDAARRSRPQGINGLS
jgi:hypothetical protein